MWNCESFKSWLRGRVGGEHRSIDISSIGWCPMENCPLLADTQYWYSVERRCCTEGRGEGLEIRPGLDWLRSDQLISRDWDSSSMTDHPEIETQLGIATLPLLLISLCLRFEFALHWQHCCLVRGIDKWNILWCQYLLPGFQYFPNNLLSLSLIGVRYSNNCSNLSITYLYIFFAVSCLVSMDGWTGGWWGLLINCARNEEVKHYFNLSHPIKSFSLST